MTVRPPQAPPQAPPPARPEAPPRATVILSTYNQPEWLELVLEGYRNQVDGDFEMIIADDGSGAATRAVVESYQQRCPFPIRHVWHEDAGFRKCKILNAAVVASRTEYLIFSDGDCLPPSDFVAGHLRLARPGRFLAGSYYKLSLEISRSIDKAQVSDPDLHSLAGLRRRGAKLDLALLKPARPARWVQRALDAVSAIKRITWNGHNASGWRADLQAVNGFDERMGYWGEDREMGLRLQNAGIVARQLRHTSCCLHLDHPRPYLDSEVRVANRAIMDATRANRLAWTPFGIVKDDEKSPNGSATAAVDVAASAGSDG